MSKHASHSSKLDNPPGNINKLNPSSRKTTDHATGHSAGHSTKQYSNRPANNSSLEVFWVFLRLGCIAFGGPAAHLAYFRHELIEQRQWFSEQQFAAWLAICQFLPGPASSQMGFMLGLQRAGWRGGFAAFLAFTFPSVVLLILFASALPQLDNVWGNALIHGLKLAACVIVADAVLGMGKRFCQKKTHFVVAGVALLFLILFESIWMQLTVVVMGAVTGCAMLLGQRIITSAAEDKDTAGSDVSVSVSFPFSVSTIMAGVLGGGFFVMLFMLPLLSGSEFAIKSGFSDWAIIADTFYRTGALVFGGGHVVLPWLEQVIVGQYGMSSDAFLAGYGATQAVPGPMFTFAAYLGALMPNVAVSVPEGIAGVSIAGALLATLAVFLPGFLLLIAVLPVWNYLSTFPLAQAGLAGVNAAVVGLLAAAWYHPIFSTSVASLLDIAIVMSGFVLLRVIKLSALWVVLVCATLSLVVVAVV